VDESELIDRHDLGPSIATARVADCRLSFHEQRPTADIWCLATGAHGTFALPLLQREPLLRLLSNRPVVDERVARRAQARYARWGHVGIGNDVVLAFRARGDALDFEYLFADGIPFGGGAAALPTARRATVIERIQMRLSGRRGARVSYARHDPDAE
jgi:hypothetical protein